jgi:hypothetical protein
MFNFWKKQPTALQSVLPDTLPGLEPTQEPEVDDGIYVKVGLDSNEKYQVEVNCPEGKEHEFTYLLMLLNNGVLYESILQAVNKLPEEQCELIYTDLTLSEDIMAAQESEPEVVENEDAPLISPLFALHSLKGGHPIDNDN